MNLDPPPPVRDPAPPGRSPELCPTCSKVWERPARTPFVRRLAWTVSLVLLLLAVASSSTAAAAESRGEDRGWFKLVSPNFELFGNTRESEARRLIRELETFRHVVSRFLGLTNVQRRPALVYLFKDDATFRPYKPRYNGQPGIVSGFHTEDPLDHVLALSRQQRGATTMRVLFHEYTHLLTARQFRHAPVWAHEGFAEVFSTFEGDGDRFDIGVALTNHVFQLQRQPPLALARLLAVTRESRDYNERSRAGPFYATSWLLAHHLLFARRGFETNVMARYAALCAATTNQLDAFQRAFGQAPAQFETAILDYVKGGQYTVVRQTYPELADARPQSRSLAPGELDYALGRLLQMTRQTGPALERLRRAAERLPSDPRPREALALEAWRGGDRPTVRSVTDEALRLGSKDAFIHFLAAEVRYQELVRRAPGTPPDAAILEDGQRLCKAAIELDPELAPAHHLLGIYVLALNPRAPALAAAHVQNALRCDPQYKPALLTWASLLASQGDLGAARRILASLLAGPLPDDLREVARRVAADIEKRAPAGTPPP